jgi:exosortase
MERTSGGLRGVGGAGIFAAGFASVALAWAYWPTLVEMAERWEHEPQYSHGYLVPLFSLFILWTRRKALLECEWRGSLLGLGILLAAVVMRIAGAQFYFLYLDPLSLLPALAGLVVLVGGWRVLRVAYPAIAFLFFMIPLPYNVSRSWAEPLQRVATEASTFALQVLGRPAVAEGNVILLNEFELGVVEACSGLRMLVVFFAIATGVAMYLKKPLWEKAFVVASAAPIALFANILRITVTGVLYESAGKEVAEAVFHDLAGWLMMPLALALLGVELWLLSRLLRADAGQKQPAPLPAAPQVFTARVRRNRIQRAAGNSTPRVTEPVPEPTPEHVAEGTR